MAAISQAQPMRRHFLRRSVRQEILGWLFASPWIIGFLLFTAGLMLYCLYTSFTNYNIIRTPQLSGLKGISKEVYEAAEMDGAVGCRGFQMGYASAMAWVLFLIILGITLLQLWLARRWVHYETER